MEELLIMRAFYNSLCAYKVNNIANIFNISIRRAKILQKLITCKIRIINIRLYALGGPNCMYDPRSPTEYNGELRDLRREIKRLCKLMIRLY